MRTYAIHDWDLDREIVIRQETGFKRITEFFRETLGCPRQHATHLAHMAVSCPDELREYGYDVIELP